MLALCSDKELVDILDRSIAIVHFYEKSPRSFDFRIDECFSKTADYIVSYGLMIERVLTNLKCFLNLVIIW